MKWNAKMLQNILRAAAVLMLLVFFAYTLSSAAVADHHCVGEHCPICLCSVLREHMLVLCCAWLCAMSLGCVFAQLCHMACLAPALAWSPVRLKVKLSN